MHIGIALPADMPQLAPVAATEFVRGHAQPGAQLAATGEALGLADHRPSEHYDAVSVVHGEAITALFELWP